MSECKQKYIEWSSKDGLYCGEYSDGLLVGQLVGTEARLEFGGWEACWNARQSEIDQLKKQLSDSDCLKVQHRERRCELAKELTRKSLRLTDAEFEYKRIKSERAKDVLTIMRQASQVDQLKAEKEKLELELSQTKQVLHNVIDIERSKVEKLKAEKAGLLRLAEQWREQSKELCRVDDKYVIGSLLSCAEELEEVVRGGHEST